MNESSGTSRIHPLYAAAAIAVILVSAAGVAALTGVLPGSHADQARNAPVAAVVPASSTALAAAPAAVSTPAAVTPAPSAATVATASETRREAAAPAPHRQAAPRTQATHAPTRNDSRDAASEERARHVADAYAGRVVSIVPVERRVPHTSGVGAVGGAVVGGLLGNQIGSGRGRTLATVAGALGGGLAGNGVEGAVRKTTEYQVRVRMDDGSYRTFEYKTAPALQEGERVRIDRDSGALRAG